MQLRSWLHHIGSNAIPDHHVGRGTFDEMNNFFFTVFIDDLQLKLDMRVPEFD